METTGLRAAVLARPRARTRPLGPSSCAGLRSAWLTSTRGAPVRHRAEGLQKSLVPVYRWQPPASACPSICLLQDLEERILG